MTSWPARDPSALRNQHGVRLSSPELNSNDCPQWTPTADAAAHVRALGDPFVPPRPAASPRPATAPHAEKDRPEIDPTATATSAESGTTSLPELTRQRVH